MPGGKTVEEWKIITEADQSLYQVKSGSFMLHYYLIMLIGMPSLCYCLCCVALCIGYKYSE